MRIHFVAAVEGCRRDKEAQQIVQVEHAIPAGLVVALRGEQGKTDRQPRYETPDSMRLDMLDSSRLSNLPQLLRAQEEVDVAEIDALRPRIIDLATSYGER